VRFSKAEEHALENDKFSTVCGPTSAGEYYLSLEILAKSDYQNAFYSYFFT